MRIVLLLTTTAAMSCLVSAFMPSTGFLTGRYQRKSRADRGIESGPPPLSAHVVDETHAIEILTSSSSLIMSTTEAWVQPSATFLGVFLNFMSLAMLSRVVLSWYPSASLKDVPWIFLVVPTEPLLRSVKGLIPPAFGVDITPVFWLAIFSFFNEILLGQQGLLTMKIKYGI